MSSNSIKKTKGKLKKQLDEWDPMREDFDNSKKFGGVDHDKSENVFIGADYEGDKGVCVEYVTKGSCSKGEFCRWLHKPISTDGLPMDSVKVYTDLKERTCPPKGSWMFVIVSALVSPSDFHIQIIRAASPNGDYRDTYAELQKDLRRYCKSAENRTPSLALPGVGELMVGKCDELPIPGFHRVRILDRDPDEEANKVKVNFLDVGVTGWMEEHNLRPLPEKFLSPPAQAVACYLSDVVPVSKNWTSKCKKFMECFVDNKILICVVTENCQDLEEKLGVVLVDPDQPEDLKSFHELLLKRQFAKSPPT